MNLQRSSCRAVHLRDLGGRQEEIEAAGGNRQGCDRRRWRSIAMGHGGMLYSLPSRELIADSGQAMVNAHCAGAMVCISNCDKITPGTIAAMRLNIPVVFVPGGRWKRAGQIAPPTAESSPRSRPDRRHDQRPPTRRCPDAEVAEVERSATMRLLFRHVHRQLE